MIIAVAVFEVAKYILEEEVIEPTEMRHAGEARRSMTKFISTIAIAVFLEALVTIFQASKAPDLSNMLYPTHPALRRRRHDRRPRRLPAP